MLFLLDGSYLQPFANQPQADYVRRMVAVTW